MVVILLLLLVAMKRQGYLLEKIADISNLELAYYKAQRGKGNSVQVQGYQRHLYDNLLRLRAHILSGDIEVGDYHFFTIYDPKKRQICAAPFAQRVLHHAVMNVCHPFFELRQTNDSYASRVGKGTYAALEKARFCARKYPWYLKLDVRKYFDSIDQGILRSQLCRMFKDARLLLLFDKIIGSYEATTGAGVPIGNLTSQYFANHYLASADHYVKEILRVPDYVRYMDDMVLWHTNKEKLLEMGHRYREYFEKQMALILKPFCLNRSIKGLPFLGYLVFPDTTLLAQRSRKRYVQKLLKYQSYLENEEWTQSEYQRRVLPLTAFTLQANAKGFRTKIHVENAIE